MFLFWIAVGVGTAAGQSNSLNASIINQYCPQWDGVCTYQATANYFTDLANCQTFMATVDESGLLCRLWHLARARSNAAQHCPHAARANPPCALTGATLPTAANFCGTSAFQLQCSISAGIQFQTQVDCEAFYTAASIPEQIFAFTSVIGSSTNGVYCQSGSMVSAVSQYCGVFNTICGYGSTANYFADYESCLVFMNGMDTNGFFCRYYHLTFAARDASTMSTHCPHAGMLTTPCPKTGAPGTTYCNTGVALGGSGGGFLNGYCVYGGVGQFPDLTACNTLYGAASFNTQICLAYHLSLSTQGNNFTHCQHASGRAPCGSAAVLAAPSVSPTKAPVSPSSSPTKMPTAPTMSPIKIPSVSPTKMPTATPVTGGVGMTSGPTKMPTGMPVQVTTVSGVGRASPVFPLLMAIALWL